jgi:hypothetical protein
MHPNIPETFYQKIEAPSDLEDAHIKMSCHNHAVDDFNLQLEINTLEISSLNDGEEVLPYNMTEADELEQKRLKLLFGKRFHQNAARAYWYHMVKAEK